MTEPSQNETYRAALVIHAMSNVFGLCRVVSTVVPSPSRPVLEPERVVIPGQMELL